MNILLSQYETPYNAIPFDNIRPADFMPALSEAIKTAQQRLSAIAADPAEASFANTIEALEESDEKINQVALIFYNLHSAETNDELQDIAENFSPLLTEFYSDLYLNGDLFERVKSVHLQRADLELNPEQLTLLEKTYKAFVRNGALLNDQDKKTLRVLDQQLSTVSLSFGDNVLEETNSFTLLIDNPEDLRGLPDNVVRAAAELAKERGHADKWVFTLDAPSYVPFMKFAEKRQLREEMLKAFHSVAYRRNNYDNQENVKSIARLRFQRAQLLGFESHAHFVLEDRMARNPSHVRTFLEDLFDRAKPTADREIRELEDLQFEMEGVRDLQRWDYSFYAEKLRKKRFNFDENTLRPFFEINNSVQGMFVVAERLYGLSFSKLDNVPVYHPDVNVYRVSDSSTDEFIGLLYTDFFPREGKRNGAWMTKFKSQFFRKGVDHRPHVSIVCNFTRPTSSKPALLSFDEVNTLFHEFGHALHGLLSRCRYRSLSGTNVHRDFVELPSQIMENWLTEKECLDMFAAHYESGERISSDLVEKIKQSATLHEGCATVRQISFGVLDLSWHTQDPDKVEDVGEFEQSVMEGMEVLPHVAMSNMSCRFSHIFRGGYSAGYYGYKWAEVLDADAFESFKDEGIFNRETAEQFREHVLSKGGSEEPMVLYERFRGKKPTYDALLKRAGFSH